MKTLNLTQRKNLLIYVWTLKLNHCSKVKTLVTTNTVNKYPKLSATVEPVFLAFPSSYMVETSFSHANVFLTKQKNRLNLVE